MAVPYQDETQNYLHSNSMDFLLSLVVVFLIPSVPHQIFSNQTRSRLPAACLLITHLGM